MGAAQFSPSARARHTPWLVDLAPAATAGWTLIAAGMILGAVSGTGPIGVAAAAATAGIVTLVLRRRRVMV